MNQTSLEWQMEDVPHKNSPDALMRWLGTILGYPSRVSAQGVPHLVLPTRTPRGKCSVCWFKRDQFFRVFAPYPNATQTRTDCMGLYRLHQILTELGVVERRA